MKTTVKSRGSEDYNPTSTPLVHLAWPSLQSLASQPQAAVTCSEQECILLLLNKGYVVLHLAVGCGCSSSRCWVTGPEPPIFSQELPGQGFDIRTRTANRNTGHFLSLRGCDTGHLQQHAEGKFHWSCLGRTGLSLVLVGYGRFGKEWD